MTIALLANVAPKKILRPYILPMFSIVNTARYESVVLDYRGLPLNRDAYKAQSLP